MDRIKGYGYAQPPHVSGIAQETADVNIVAVHKYMLVTPSEPQTLVWVVPGNDVTYNIESNVIWNIE